MSKMNEEIAGITNTVGSGAVAPHPKPMGFPMLSRRRYRPFEEYHKKIEKKTKDKAEENIEAEEKRKKPAV